MNSVFLTGKVARNPIIKNGAGFKYALFEIAVKRSNSKSAYDYIDCIASSNTAVFVEKYIHEGIRIFVSGRLSTVLNKNGTVAKTSVSVSNIEFCEKKNS